MALISLFDVFIAFLCFLFLHFLLFLNCFLFKKPIDRYTKIWPIFGMLPGILVVLHRIYDFTVEHLQINDLTFQFKGPLFAGIDMLFTVDPANINYMLSSNFSNYTKGADFKEIFDAFGDSIVTSDAEEWKSLRKASQVIINHQGFQSLSISTTRSKLKDGLVPLFNHFAEEGITVDLQDVFGRFMFDTTLVIITGCDDPRSFSIEMPEVEFAKALDDLGEGVLHRHLKPRLFWKLQNLIGVGLEKKMREAGATFDRECEKYISAKREEITRSQGLDHSDGESKDILASHMKLDTTKNKLLKPINDKFLRDTILAFTLAGRDTVASALTWFFWLLSENPNVLAKIRQEIDTNLPRSCQESQSYDPMELANKLVYLHAALCETMRLYPPVPIERVTAVNSDVLPSGHKVEANSKVLLIIYALGRMKAVWGENASEFKPERWISETGMFRHEPSFKFLVFNSGPRTCLGKHIAMIVMKTMAVEILQNYDFKVVKGQKIEPSPHLILTMKHGFRVTINKRCSS